MSNNCLCKKLNFSTLKGKFSFLLNKIFVLTKMFFIMALCDTMGRFELDCRLLLLAQSCSERNEK
jgi:hypothetical protein